jgi:hypothetical protein
MAPGVKFNVFEVFFFFCEISDLTHAHIAAILNIFLRKNDVFRV